MFATCDVSNSLRLGAIFYCDFGNFVMLLSWNWSKLAAVTTHQVGVWSMDISLTVIVTMSLYRQMNVRDRYVVRQVLFVYILMRWSCAIF